MLSELLICEVFHLMTSMMSMIRIKPTDVWLSCEYALCTYINHQLVVNKCRKDIVINIGIDVDVNISANWLSMCICVWVYVVNLYTLTHTHNTPTRTT